MKNSLLSLAVAASVSIAAPVAIATDGTLNFNGEITAPTCTVTGQLGASGDGDITVQLREYSASAFQGSGSVIGETEFMLQIDGSSCANGKIFSLDFRGGGTHADTNGNLNNAAAIDAAEGVQIQVLNGSRQPINFKTGENAPTSGVSMNNKAQIYMFAQYYAKSRVSEGLVNASVEFVLTHN